MAGASEVGSFVSEACIQELLEVFSRGSYKAKNSQDRRNEIIHKRCIHLIARDYDVEVIDNKAGQFCGHYPSELIVIERHKTGTTRSTNKRPPINNASQLKELISTARYARCRSRFIMPVILFENKNVCRSATLSTMAEMYGRAGMDWFTGGDTSSVGAVPYTAATERAGVGVAGSGGGGGGGGRGVTRSPSLSAATPGRGGQDKDESEFMTRVRGQDVQLLKRVGVELICDLMVEKKKSKYGLLVASSEKVDKWARYCDFQIASMPYPGCEFFREYAEKECNAAGLHFDWTQSMIDADLLIPESLQRLTQITFKSYQEWDLVHITLNYLRLFLTYLKHGKGGLLIHCISGWDRTPLFISLLRLSLWADGSAHNSLSPEEMLYFTLAYDWFAFGHPFKERRDKGEEIMFFCFDFLKYLTSDDLSVNSESSGVLNNPLHQMTSSSSQLHASHSHSELGDSWVVEELSAEKRHSAHTNGTYHIGYGSGWQDRDDGCCYPPQSSKSHHTALCHLGSSSQSCCPDHSKSSVPRSKSYPNPLSTSSSSSSSSSMRCQRLLTVRTLFQKAYRTAVSEVQLVTQGGGAMAFASGLLSKLPLFGSSNNDTHV